MSAERIPGNVLRRNAVAHPELWKWFRADGTLERMPASAADRLKVLEHIASRFARERDYDEREVNLLLAQVDPDAAMLRRYLVDAGLMTRAGGRYRRA